MHHEQSCGYAAVGYAKTTYKPAAVCVTAGAATTNCATPCLVAYQDSTPVLFLSGQVKTTDTIRSIHETTNPSLRNYAFADCDIISIVKPITKYAHEIRSVGEVKQVLRDAMQALKTGRPGPVWISVPLDVQGASIDGEIMSRIPNALSLPTPDWTTITEKLRTAKRPIILAGNGINLAGCRSEFRAFVDTTKIPVVTTLLGLDLLETASPYFVGRVGSYGDRAGNFSIQNSDLVLVLGSSLSSSVVGYKPEWFARDATMVYVDTDPAELAKPQVRPIIRVQCELGDFFANITRTESGYSEWLATCGRWKQRWMFEYPPDHANGLNPYPALKCIFDRLPENKTLVSMTGSIATLVWHMNRVKANDKFIFNGQGDMGPDLPASIGAYLAAPTKPVFTIVGEGALQFNIQELQTIVHHAMPIKLLVFNNASYGAIEITQRANFKGLYGLNAESGVSFPDTGKIATAYGIPYQAVRDLADLPAGLDALLAHPGPMILEIFCCVQGRCPKLSARKLPDGTFTSLPFEDMEPFLSREEFYREMIVKPLSNSGNLTTK
jgi:acetolactate synthase-1/2/3 large subunit